MADKDLFYKVRCDSIVQCKDGELKINREMLNQRTPKFSDIIIEDRIIIPEYETSIFKVFLDILMGFDQLTQEKSLLIFPLVNKFDVQDLIIKCIAQLKPTSSMDEGVVLTLNVSIDCECDDLTDAVIDFLLSYGLNRLFLQEEYYSLLEPKSVALLLRFAFKNPLILRSIVNWGRKYIEKTNIDNDLRTFLAKNRILNKLSIECLDSYDAVLQLYDTNPKNNIFTKTEILNYLKTMSIANESKFEWVDVQEGQFVIENFELKLPLVVSRNTTFCFSFNQIACNFLPPKESRNDCFFECTINMHTRLNQESEMVTTSEFKILSGENMGSSKTQIIVSLNSLQDSEYNQLYFIKANYKFFRDCKLLKTSANLPPLKYAPDNDELYFTCAIRF